MLGNEDNLIRWNAYVLSSFFSKRKKTRLWYKPT